MNPLAQRRSFEPPPGGGSGRKSAKKIGRFEVIEEIGKGSMGVVYLARDPMIGRWVAVKKLTGIKGKLLDSEVVRRLLINEARNVGALEHPGIVMVFDLIEGKDGKVDALAMEYVAGKSLRERLNDPEPFSLSYVSEVVSAVAEVLDYAHENGCIHRDIKPANVLLADDGVIKVADFGIAALRGEDLATELRNLGTPNYLAPERVLGQPGDQHTDIYSLGVILYELLTRHLPFEATSISELVRNIIQEEPTPPERFVPEMMPGLRRILTRALAKDSEDRYPTAGALASDLREIVAAQAALNDTVPAPMKPKPSKPKRPAAETSPPVPVEPAPAENEPEEILAPLEPEVVEWESLEAENESADAGPARPGIEAVRERIQKYATALTAAVGPWIARARSKLGQLAAAVAEAARSRPALAFVFAFVLALPVLLLVPGGGTELPERPVADVGVRARPEARYLGLLLESRRLAEAGSRDSARQILAQAEGILPENREEVQREALLEVAMTREAGRLESIDRLVEDTHLQIARADFAGAARSIEALSQLDAPGEALELLESSLAHSKARVRRARRQAVTEEPVEVAEAAPVVEPVVQPVVVRQPPPRTGPGILRFEVSSARPRGVLTVYSNGEQILNRPYRFVEKKNFFVRKGVSGSFRESLELSAGVRELKIYLSQPKRETQLRSVTVKVPAGDIRVLRLRVQANGKLVIGSS
ncbi:MAG: serine/threonine-protein kinase [Thermoanaerobaculia bacterium]